jgi:hypothetical protein
MGDIDTILRLTLGIDLLLVVGVAWLYLLQRRMAWWAYCLWGLFALLVPLIGPIFVILSRPGSPRKPGG